MCSDRAHAATRDAPGRRTTETRARRRVMALEIMIVRHSAAGCRSRLGAPSPQRSSGLHGGQASSQIIHGEKEVRTSGALGGIAAASTARLETQHPLGSGGPTRRKPLAALLQTARLLLTASLRRKVQFAPAAECVGRVRTVQSWSCSEVEGPLRPRTARWGARAHAQGRWRRWRVRSALGAHRHAAGPEHPRHFSFPRPPAAAPVLLRRMRSDARPGRAVPGTAVRDDRSGSPADPRYRRLSTPLTRS